VRDLGFEVIEMTFGEPMSIADTPFELTPLEHDGDANDYDSAVVVHTPEFTLFENNDCVLHADTYRWLRDRLAIDYAFLGYSPASAFPICFELPPAEKEKAAARRRRETVRGASPSRRASLAPGLTVPFANGMRFLAERSLWRNAAFSAAAGGRAARAGDRPRQRGDAAGGSHPRRRPGASPLRCRRYERRARGHRRIRAHHAGVDRRSGLPAGRRPATTSWSVSAFASLALWRAARERHPDVPRPGDRVRRSRCAARARFYFDFSRPDDAIFAWGEPARYDMRYTYPARALAMALDGAIDWEEVHFRRRRIDPSGRLREGVLGDVPRRPTIGESMTPSEELRSFATSQREREDGRGSCKARS
jgi:hypothetical protein